MKFISLFAGVGGFDLALTRLGHTCVYVNEWDTYAAQTYEKNFKHRPDTRSIRDVPTEDIPDHDLLVGGFPCQSFSIAGKRGGFQDTRGTLFFEIARIAKAKRPAYLFLENVKGLLNHNEGNTFATIIATLDELGYDCQWQVLNSKNFGVPQNRERVFIIGHLRGQPRPEVFPLQSTDEVCSRSDTSEEEIYAGTLLARQYANWGGNFIKQVNQPKILAHYGHIDKPAVEMDIAPTLKAQSHGHEPMVMLTERRTDEAKAIRREMMKQGKDWSPRRGKELAPREDNLGNTLTANQSKEHLLTDGATIRRLTPKECLRLQGFPDDWFDVPGLSDTQKYKQAGNAITVSVVYEIAKRAFCV